MGIYNKTQFLFYFLENFTSDWSVIMISLRGGFSIVSHVLLSHFFFHVYGYNQGPHLHSMLDIISTSSKGSNTGCEKWTCSLQRQKKAFQVVPSTPLV
jgi:hypothetical protein